MSTSQRRGTGRTNLYLMADEPGEHENSYSLRKQNWKRVDSPAVCQAEACCLCVEALVHGFGPLRARGGRLSVH